MKETRGKTELKRALMVTLTSAAGPVGQYLADRLLDARLEDIDRAIRSLRRQLERLRERLVDQVDETEELREVLLRWQNLAHGTLDQRRLEAAACVVAHSLLDPEDAEHIAPQQAEFLMHVIDSLSAGSLRVLATAYRIATTSSHRAVTSESIRVDFGRLHKQLPLYDPDYLMGLVGDLDRFNLLHKLGTPGVAVGEKYENYPIHLTPLGAQFVQRLLTEGSSAKDEAQ